MGTWHGRACVGTGRAILLEKTAKGVSNIEHSRACGSTGRACGSTGRANLLVLVMALKL